MQDTGTSPGAAAADLPKTAGRPGRRGRVLLRALGALFLAAAFGVGGYLSWLLWGTGIETQRWQSAHRGGFEKLIDTKAPTDPGADRVRLPGTAIAIIQIPRIDLDMVVVEGTDTASLAKGPGHYTNTAYPWQDHGRVGIAGHRTTYLHPFFNLDRMRVGDPIILQTEYGTFRYVVTRVFVSTPSDVSVLDQTRRPTLVLTTCNPRYSAWQRLIVDAVRAGPR